MASTFISNLLPLVVVVSMQRYFVRGVPSGAVEG